MGQALFPFNPKENKYKNKQIDGICLKEQESKNFQSTVSLKGCKNWQNQFYNKHQQLLTEITLVSCSISDNTIKKIFSKFYPNLQKLSLCENEFTGKSLSELLNYSLLFLTQLNLSNNKIDSTGIKFLVKAHLPNLIKMDINDCIIGNEGFQHLTKSMWSKLLLIDVRNNKKRSDILSIFSNSWTQLRQIWTTESESISCLGYFLFQSPTVKINKYFYTKIHNSEKIWGLIKKIFESKHFLDQ